MDPVSRVLLERERSAPRLTPWVVAAVLLHATVVVAVLLLGELEPPRPAALPAVSVRIVSPRLVAPPGETGGGGRPAPARAQPKPPVSQPQKPRQPKPQPKPVRNEPEPVRPKPVQPTTSDDAMPGVASEKRPRPQAEEPAASGGGDSVTSSGPVGPRPGLSLAGGGTGGAPALPSDFQFSYYVERMLALIGSKWYRPPVPAGTHAQVRFTIASGGRLEGVELEKSSGISSFDRAVLRALYACNPLPPLPPAYRRPSLTVHLTFAR